MSNQNQAYKFFQDVISEALTNAKQTEVPPDTGVAMTPIAKEGADEENSDNWIGIHYIYEPRMLNPTNLVIVAGEEQFGIGLSETEELLQETNIDFPDFRWRWLSKFKKHPDGLVFQQIFYLASILNNAGYECRAADWESAYPDNDEVVNKQNNLLFPILHFYDALEAWSCIVRCQPIIRK